MFVHYPLSKKIKYLLSVLIMGIFDIVQNGKSLLSSVMLNVALKEGSSKQGKALLA